MKNIDIGISENDREAIVTGLKTFLADTYVLYLKTHNFHWNIEGPMFNTLHLMFEQQYTEMALAVDEIAERIRALGFYAPASFGEYLRLASIKEEDHVPNDKAMIKYLLAGQEAVIKTARCILLVAEKASDQVTLDLLTRRMQVHEKNAWMLRSLLNG